MSDVSGVPLDRIEMDELPLGPRRELLARDRTTGRVVSVAFPAAWSDVEFAAMLGDDYEPVLEIQ